MDVLGWLKNLGFEQYEAIFRDNDIDASVLSALTNEDLKDLGVASVGHRRKLLEAIALLRHAQFRGAPRDLSLVAAPEAERRQLTLMFCDLVGSTELSARLDPEDLREVIGAYHRAVAEKVGRLDGFVAKYMGDGVLVYFGYPRAHEDDAERAVRAGLSVVDGVGCLDVKSIKLQARVGIATGMVVVGDLIGEGSAREQSVVGETPNLAARLQAVAEPNTVVIAASTHRLVGDLFEYRDLGTVEVKGIAAPILAWQVLRASTVESRFEALRATALTPLVGREEEIELLLRRWRRAKAGEGQVVLISGEPGIGKSRLSRAVGEHIGAEPHFRPRYFCSLHHRDSTLHPFVAQLERVAGFARDDAPATRLDKLEALLAQSGGGAGETIGLIADLLSLPSENRYPPLPADPQWKREMTLSALLCQLELLAAQRPVIMIFEDAHWADSSSLELIDRTVERVAGLPVLLIITFRPEFAPPWVGQPHVSSLSLNRLDRREITAVVGGITGGKRLPADILDRIVERTDGIPLFIEELTRTLLEGGLLREEEHAYALAGPLPPLAIPSSLQDSLMARLDRLTPVKEVAQIGAAIGREFSYDLLAAVARRTDEQLRSALDQLTEAGLVFRRGMPPRASFMFKHALVQEAAYNTLLRSQRQELHARIAKGLEAQFPEVVEVEPETLARHYTEADLVDVAVDYWNRAGVRALQRSAHLEAAGHLTHALTLIKRIKPGRNRSQLELDLQISLASALHSIKGQSAPEVADAYQRARQLCEEVDDPQQLFRVLMGLYRFYGGRMHGDIAFEIVEQLYSLAEQSGDSDLLLQGHMALGTIQLLWGDLDAAQHHLDAAITRYAPDSHRSHAVRFNIDPGILSLSRASWALWFRGYPDQAVELDNRTLALARRLGHAQSLGMALCFSAALYQFRREPTLAQAIAQEAAEVSGEHRFAQYAAEAGFLLGWAVTELGQSEAGFAQMRQSFFEYRRLDVALDLPWYLGLLAEVSSSRGEVDEGLALLDQAEDITRTNVRTSLHLPEWHRIKGELLLARGWRGEAEQSFLSSLASANKKGARGIVLRAATSLARLWGEQGRRAGARELLAPVYGWFTEGFDTADLNDAKALLEALDA